MKIELTKWWQRWSKHYLRILRIKEEAFKPIVFKIIFSIMLILLFALVISCIFMLLHLGVFVDKYFRFLLLQKLHFSENMTLLIKGILWIIITSLMLLYYRRKHKMRKNPPQSKGAV